MPTEPVSNNRQSSEISDSKCGTFHFPDCPCFGDSVEHDEDCANCTCVATIEQEMRDEMRAYGGEAQWMQYEARKLWNFALRNRREVHRLVAVLLELERETRRETLEFAFRAVLYAGTLDDARQELAAELERKAKEEM